MGQRRRKRRKERRQLRIRTARIRIRQRSQRKRRGKRIKRIKVLKRINVKGTSRDRHPRLKRISLDMSGEGMIAAEKDIDPRKEMKREVVSIPIGKQWRKRRGS